jgi:mono/diheme cytochrome c family protein
MALGRKLAIWLIVLSLFATGVAIITRGMGFTSRAKPWAAERAIARWARSWAVPAASRTAKNPVALNALVLQDAMAHFADHCASCHANDGSGSVPMGRGLYPPPPDMRAAATQNLSDGELFYIIERGVPLTGMPAWGSEGGDGHDSWAIVHFIRHLPQITPAELAEMEQLNPKSPPHAQPDRDKRIDDFLKGRGGRPD